MISSIIMPFSIMQLTVSYISPVSQQDIEVSIKQLDIYIYYFDVVQRRFLKSVVGPPRKLDWKLLWHEILAPVEWRHSKSMEQSKCKTWSETCLQHH